MNDFDKWNELKKEINKKEVVLKFRERDIFFLHVGKNIGYEQNGKGEEFLRPVIVYKKLSKYYFIGIPLSSKEKIGNYFFNFYHNNKKQTALFNQVRVFDIRRAKYSSGKIGSDTFRKLQKSFIEFITPHNEGSSPSGQKSEKILSKNNVNVNHLKKYYSQIRDIKVGKNVVVVEPVNLYECELRDNVFVGPFVEIQKGVIIGENTRIQSHSFICELVTIGKNCFIGHGVMFVNDLFKDGKPAGDKNKWKETIIGDNVSIGSNATILPVKICSNVVIGAGSVVTKDIVESGIYAGNPARKIRSL